MPLALAITQPVCRYDADHFDDWFFTLQEKAGHRVDPMTARHLWERGFSVMDAMVKIMVK